MAAYITATAEQALVGPMLRLSAAMVYGETFAETFARAADLLADGEADMAADVHQAAVWRLNIWEAYGV